MLRVLLAALLFCSAACAADLQLVDFAMVYQDQLHHTHGVFHNSDPLFDPYATCVNYRGTDNQSWPMCDTVWAVAEVYTYPRGPFDWNTVRYMDFASQERGNRNFVWHSILGGLKVNQTSPLVDSDEAARFDLHLDPQMWLVYNWHFNNTDWLTFTSPYYQNYLNMSFGNVPPQFQGDPYFVVYHMTEDNSVLWIDEHFRPNCRWSVWFADSLPGWTPPYPTDLSNLHLTPPDSGTAGAYTVWLDSLNLPAGEYQLRVVDFNGNMIRELTPITTSTPSPFQFELTDAEVALHPDRLEIFNEQVHRKVVLLQQSQFAIWKGGAR
jgi:hypothetical protein